MNPLGIFLLGAVLGIILARPYDDTDSRSGLGRSGMELRTDHGTGCQYLALPGSPLAPRRDGQGRHMGCRP